MSITDSKALRLLSVLAKDPLEFLDRSRMIASAKLSAFDLRKAQYEPVDWTSLVESLAGYFGAPFAEALAGRRLTDLAPRLRARMESLPSEMPFGAFHNGDSALAELCYAIVRATRPKTVLETGVCYGVTSSHLLSALEANGQGHLYSIDLPPLGKDGDDYVGWLVPDELRKRWTLRRGTSSRLLAPLLRELDEIDLFVHDSLHTYNNMKMEFNLAWSSLLPGGVLIADDVEGNAAFHEFANQNDVAFHAVIRERAKNSLAGVLIKAKPK